MRHLIACPGCARQYDVTGLAVGTRLACLCGVGAEVQPPRSHASDVVRCSSCGASRASGSAACAFCGGDFTLHEQDLHTICPACLARISDRARFCHGCGVAVAPQPASVAGQPRPCPACPGRTLEHRALPGAAPLLECARCLGFWIEPQALRGLLERADARSEAARLLGNAGTAGTAPTAPGAVSDAVVYRSCPACATRMNRRRFPGGARVIVDYCREHGLWFDARELERVLQAAAQGLGSREEVVRLPGDEAAEGAERLRRLNQAWRAEGPLPKQRPTNLLEAALRLLERILS